MIEINGFLDKLPHRATAQECISTIAEGYESVKQKMSDEMEERADKIVKKRAIVEKEFAKPADYARQMDVIKKCKCLPGVEEQLDKLTKLKAELVSKLMVNDIWWSKHET